MNVNLDKLKDPEGNNWNRELMKLPSGLLKNQVSPCLKILTSLFKSNLSPKQGNDVLLALCRTVSVGKNAIVFAQENLVESLPFDNEDLQEQLLDLIYILVNHQPVIFVGNVCKKFSRLFENYPKKCLYILAAFAQKKETVQDYWGMLDLLLKSCSKHLRVPELAEEYITILMLLLRKEPMWRKNRGEKCWTNICSFLQYKKENIVAFTYNALSLFASYVSDYHTYSDFPTEFIVKHIKRPKLQQPIISLLLRRLPDSTSPEFPQLIKGLLVAAQTSEEAALVLMECATTVEGAKILVDDTEWFTQPLPTVENTMRLFAVVMSHKNLRGEIIQSDHILDFLLSIFDISDQFIYSLSALCTFIRRLPVDKKFLHALSEIDFIRNYFNKVLKASDDSCYHSTLLLIDYLGRTGYTKEYDMMVSWIVNLITKKPPDTLTPIAAQVSVTLCQYPQCAKKFNNNKLVDFFQKKQKDPKMQKIANKFLKTYENIEA